MSMQKSGNVAVFWDYENSPTPTNTSGYAIANSISSLARSFGTIKVFKAYLEISDQSRSSLRSELQSSGVSLVDCPHNGRKDVADKMILVDMLSYAIDNPAPSTIFLITGDRDFAYALSVLKNRHYRVVLVKRPETHVSLTFQACICFDWYDDVVYQAENPSSQAEKSTQRAYQRHRQFSNPTCNPLSSPWHPASEGSNSSGADTEGTVDIVDYLRDRISDRVPPALQDHPQVSTATDQSPRQDQAVSSSPNHHRRGPSFSNRRDSNSNPSVAQEKQQTSFKHQSAQPEIPRIVPPLPCKDDSPVIKGMPSVKLGPLHSTSASLSADPRALTKASATFPKILEPTGDVSISPLSSPVMWPAPTTPISIATRGVAVPGAGATLHPPELAKKFLWKEPANNTTPISPSSANHAISSPSPKPPTSDSTTVDTVQPSIESAVAPEPMDAKAVDPARSNNSSQTVLRPDRPTEALDTPLVPPKFVILVEALQSERSRGIFLSLRSIISGKINKNGATYRNAGVSSFRQYSLLALQEGIVELGGTDGRDWIRLKPKWHNVHIVAPTTIPSSTTS